MVITKQFADNFANKLMRKISLFYFKLKLTAYACLSNRYSVCGCVNPMQWNARSIILPGTDPDLSASICQDNVNYACITQAVDVLLNSPSLQEEYCSDCSQQCSVKEFPIQNSALLSPLEWQMSFIKTFVENSSIAQPTDWSTSWQSYIQKNYLILNVVRQTTTVENSTQSAQINVVDVLSNIGGQTGLWIGISFLSLMEFAEMIYRLIRHQLRRIKMKFTNKVTTQKAKP